MDNSDRNVQRIIAHGMLKRKLTKSIGLKRHSWEKARPTELERTSSRALDP